MPAGVSAYVPLANITLGSAAASVTFSSISQAYRDLVLVVNGNAWSGFNDLPRFWVNADTGANYSYVIMAGNGTSASSTSSTQAYIPTAYWLAQSGTPQFTVNVMDYSATDKHKSMLVRGQNPDSSINPNTSAIAGRWASTSAITSIIVSAGSTAQWGSGTTMALYGVSA